jgi:transposase
MEVLYERCCGIDVHKSSVAACIVLERGQKPQRHLRRFGCTTHELRELAEWLRSFDVRHVAMESTGVYWKPVWNVLEEHFHMVLANAQHIKAVPGRKTDMMDCQWIAELLRHGLLRGSYVPSAVIRDLRDLTRTRATLSQEQSGISSRIQKLLESANIKLASTVTHTMGKSGQAILDAIVNGEDSPERLADLALGKLRSKIPQLQLALDGRIRDHHRFLLDSLLRQYRFLEAEIQALDTRLKQLGEQHQELGITKAGNAYLRSLLIECANHIPRPHGRDSALRQWGFISQHPAVSRRRTRPSSRWRGSWQYYSTIFGLRRNHTSLSTK